MNFNKNKSTLAIAISIGVIFLVVLFSLSAKNKNKDVSPTSGDSVEETVLDQNTVTAGVVVGEDSIYITEAFLNSEGFIVVQDYDVNTNTPGDVLGVSDLLEPGSYSDLYIDIANDVSNEGTVYVTIYLDNKDGSFDMSSDSVALDNNGSDVKSIIKLPN